MRIPNYITFFYLLIIVGVGTGCGTTSTLKDNELLLQSHPGYERVPDKGVTHYYTEGSTKKRIKPGKLTVEYDDLWEATKTKPNRTILFFKPYLNLYNLGVYIRDKDHPLEKLYYKFSSLDNLPDRIADVLINTAGEPPVVIDTAALNADARNIESLYFSKGFFHANVGYRIDTIIGEYENDRAKVAFLVEENEMYLWDSVRIEAQEPFVSKLLEASKGESLLKRGERYDEEKLTNERNRITAFLRNRGFYKFTPSVISYKIDTNPGRKPRILPENKTDSLCKALSVVIDIPGSHQLYKVRNVRMLLEPPQVGLTDIPFQVPNGMVPDWLREELEIPGNVLNEPLGIDFVIYRSLLGKVNVQFLDQLVAMRPGNYWSTENERRTQRRLQDLGVFKYVLLKYVPDDSLGVLDIEIQAQFTQRYSFKAGLEGFTRNDQVLQSQLPGIGGEVKFTDRYVFRGAEHLDLTGSGNIAFYRAGRSQPLQVFYEFGVKAELSYPRFLLPFQGNVDLTRFSPRTGLQFNLNSQHRNEYDRLQLGLNWNYSWFHSSLNQKSRSSISPYIVNLIRSRLSDQFRDQILGIESNFLRSFVELDFKSRFSSRFNYKFTYSDYGTSKIKPTNYVQPVFEFGGNTPYLIDRLSNWDGSFTDGRIDSVYYGQFVKLSTELKRRIPFNNKKQELVFRAFTGVAVPWNFTTQVPFDARFFSGGTNSMRAWQSNSLGPGGYSSTELDGVTNDFEFLISPGGEFVLEFNAEYRFNVYKFIELAIFSDVGNVWFLPGSSFQFPSGTLSRDFYRQLGWDAGLGVRLDFSFFIFRVDLAQQIYAPDLGDFVVKSFPRGLGANRFQVNFGIGYPF